MGIKKFAPFVLSLALVSFTSTQAWAYSGERQYRFFGYRIPGPPSVESDAYRADFTKLHEYQDTRTPEQCELAGTQSHLTLANAFGPQTGILTAAEMKKAKILSLRVFAKVAIPVYYFKQKFKRARPFRTDTSLNPCISKPGKADYAYPSGHSTTGYALALALARKFPYKRDLIMKQGLQIGENRLIGGVHHPSDVAVGRKLAEQVVKNMIITRGLTEDESFDGLEITQ